MNRAVRRNAVWVLFLIIGLALWARGNSESSEDQPGVRIELFQEQGGCSNYDSKLTEWKLCGDNYVSKTSSKSFSRAQVQQLRSLLRHSSRGRQHLVEEVGINPENVAAHRGKMLQALEVPDLTPDLAALLTCQRYFESAEGIAFDQRSTSWSAVRFRLGGQPPLEVSARDGLPFRIQYGLEDWETCSLAVPDAILEWSSAPGVDRCLWAGDYWRNEFWGDLSGWRDLMEGAHDQKGRAMAQARPGYAALLRDCELQQAHFRSNLLEYQYLSLDLRPRVFSQIDRFEWLLTTECTDLSKGTRLLRRCDQLLARHPWIGQWRRGKNHRIEFSPEGYSLVSRSAFEPWKAAGLPGQPEAEVELRSGSDGLVRLLLSSQSDSTLMTEGRPSSQPGRHWADRAEVFYQTDYPDYILVDASGTPHSYRAPRDEPPVRF